MIINYKIIENDNVTSTSKIKGKFYDCTMEKESTLLLWNDLALQNPDLSHFS